ncbi:MAG: trypsin-like serine protease [Armatimonadia bacterium]|nr:trypsin-like serine protease [Armatimonadia bacterium]
MVKHGRATLMGMSGLTIIALCGAMVACGIFLAGCPDAGDDDGAAVGPSPGTTGEATGALDQQRLNELLKDAVVLIEVDRQLPDGTIEGGGSGFVVNDQGRIITNAHVVSPVFFDSEGNQHVATGRSVRVVFNPATEQEETLQADVVRENEDLDLALLRVSKQTPTYLELGDAETAEELTKIICAGHPAGLREISLRTGAITAHRTFEGKEWIEHDAEAEWGNSGGPIVNEAGEVLGVATRFHWNRILASKWAVPSNTLRDWLASDPAEDPPVYFATADTGGATPGRVQVTEGDRPPSTAQTALEEILAATGLPYSYWKNDTWQIEYENMATVYVSEFDDILRAYVIFGDFPGNGGLPALAFMWHDPVGRFSVATENDVDKLYWEAQVPMGAATPEYLRELCDIGARQVESFLAYLTNEQELETPTELYPGGDPEQLHAELEQILDESGMVYEVYDEENFKMPFEGDIDVYVKVFNGMAYVHSYTGGMPGNSEEDIYANAAHILRMNYQDPIGRLAMDDELDIVWECQVPMSYLTPDYLYVVASIGSQQVTQYLEVFGDVPFREAS